MPEEGKKVLTSAMTDEIAEILKAMDDVEFDENQTIDLNPEKKIAIGNDVAWAVSYDT